MGPAVVCGGVCSTSRWPSSQQPTRWGAGYCWVSGPEMQEGRKVLEASQACSVCGVKPGAQCQALMPLKVDGDTGKEGAHRPSWPEDCVRRLWGRNTVTGTLRQKQSRLGSLSLGLHPPVPGLL